MSGDEFVTPSVITRRRRDAAARPCSDGDSVIFYNYRGDRPRELTKAFVLADFAGFDRGPEARPPLTCTMTAYEQGLPVHVAYPKPPKMTNILGEYVSQPRAASSSAAPRRRSSRTSRSSSTTTAKPRSPARTGRSSPAPQDVSTYDQKPEMSAYGICDEVVEAHRQRTCTT